MFAHYGFDDIRNVLRLPLVTFWMLNKNIDRLNAEEDLRLAEISVRTGANSSEESLRSLLEDLRKQLGRIVKYDEAEMARNAKPDVLDEEAIADLNYLGDLANVSSRRA